MEQFRPTPQDVERYRSLRAISRELHEAILRTVPGEAFEHIANALGILRDGMIVLDSEDVSAVISDACLYDWYEDGKNLVERYTEAHPAAPDTGRALVMRAFLDAKYRILAINSTAPGAGLHCRDVLTKEDLFLMDVALSQTSPKVVLAARTLPLGGYWMTTGAPLPFNVAADVESAMDQILATAPEFEDSPSLVSLSTIRACLAGGAANHVAYATPEKRRREPRLLFKRSKRRDRLT